MGLTRISILPLTFATLICLPTAPSHATGTSVAGTHSAITAVAGAPARGDQKQLVANQTTTQPSAAERRMASALTSRAADSKTSSGFSGAVIDTASNRLVWSKRGTTRRMPASTAKLATAITALSIFGPDHRFRTMTRRAATSSRVYLVGSGDPSLTTADLRSLARATASKLRRDGRTRVSVWADDTAFPAPGSALGWKSTYVPSEVRPVRALAVDGHRGVNTTTHAAEVFSTQLRATGIIVVGTTTGKAPAKARWVASLYGDRLSEIVADMLLPSDNDIAEALHRLVAIAGKQPATWAGAAKAQRAALQTDGLTIRSGALNDGSGLSRANRITAVELARIADNAVESGRNDFTVLSQGAMPLAGRTGTLGPSYQRFTGSAGCAAGKVTAKTGSLRDVVALVGWTTDADGRTKAFAFVVNGPPASLARRQRLDLLAATITGCV
ncbi:MAG: D-alanyl-D-alanine carboxypeptidase/D-alanyl-D-alanine endopeptidase [Actinomycetota bacterium]